MTYGTSHPDGKYNNSTMLNLLWPSTIKEEVVRIQASPLAL